MKRSIPITSFVLIILFLIPIFHGQGLPSTNNNPTIDGSWEQNEWKTENITLNNLKNIQFGYTNNNESLFFTIRYLDKTPSFYNGNCTSPIYSTCFDGVAIEFDLNGDHVYMGNRTSPDDLIMVGSYGNSSSDAFVQGTQNKMVLDTENNGTDDTYGRFSYSSDQYFTFEFEKKMQSNDLLGHDVNLTIGSSIDIMIGYWDNLPPRTDVTSYSNWFSIAINNTVSNSSSNTITNSLPQMEVTTTFFTIIAVFIFEKYLHKKKL